MGCRSGYVKARILPMGFAAMLLASCSPGARGPAPAPSPEASALSRHPESGLPVIALTVDHQGRQHDFRVEVAGSATEQAMGLMFRRSMGADEGMLFPMSPARFASFWMKNTVMPLDIIFIGTDGRIVNIAANAVPYSEENRRSAAPVKAVLELGGGRAAQLGIGPGDLVKW